MPQNVDHTLSERPLVEIYATNRRHSRSIRLENIDSLLLGRPDYVIWRLFRQRHPIFNELINNKTGASLLIDQIKKASNSNNEIKWTCYALTVHSLLMMALSDPREWYTRHQLSTHEEIFPTDKLDNSHIELLLNWVTIRHKKFIKKLDSDVAINEYLSMTNLHRNTIPLGWTADQIKPFEQYLLLGLGTIAILAMRHKLGHDIAQNFKDNFLCISKCFTKILGFWRPGYFIPISKLFHKREGYLYWRFESCYLPFIGDDYNNWIASSFGFLSEYIIIYANSFSEEKIKRAWYFKSLMFTISSIGHRNKLKIDNKRRDYEDKITKLLVTIDKGIEAAILANSHTWEWGLAAFFLKITVDAGIKNKKVPLVRVQSINFHRLQAKVAGCLVPKEIEDNNWLKNGQTFLQTEPKTTRDFLRKQRHLIKPIADKEKKKQIYASADQQAPIFLPEKINIIATLLRKPDIDINSRRGQESILMEAINSLLDGEDISCFDLLEQERTLFYLFAKSGYISGIAALSRRLRETNRLTYSSLSDDKCVSIFASMLLDLLEWPFMADIDVRCQWQNELLHVYANLTESSEKRLSMTDLLSIFSAATHVSTVSVRGLPDEIGDQIERTIYQNNDETEDSTSGGNSFWRLKVRSRLKILRNEVSEVLYRYKNRIGETALAQLLLVNPTTVKILLIGCSGDRHLQHRVTTVTFEPNIHSGYQFSSWHDLIRIASREELFNGVTGKVFDIKYLSAIGNNNMARLWGSVERTIRELYTTEFPEHLLLVPDPELGILPWQYIARAMNIGGATPSSVSLIPGVNWAYLVGHAANRIERTPHSLGVKAWIANEPTPNERNDIRHTIETEHLGISRGNDNFMQPGVGTLLPGVSLSVVLGHGHKRDKSSLVEVDATAVKIMEDWDEVRRRRICALLSCHTGYGETAGLRDYVGVVSFLLRSSRVVIAPPVLVPHTAVLTLSETLGVAIAESISTENLSIYDAYHKAILKDPAVALFSLWGLAHDPVVWKSGKYTHS